MRTINYDEATSLLEHNTIKAITVLSADAGTDIATGLLIEINTNDAGVVQLIAEAEPAEQFPVISFIQR